MNPVFREKLFQALALQHDYRERTRLEGGRLASVLMLFGYSRAQGGSQGSPALLVTRRTDSVGSHKGQMAFPGGMAESDESSMGAPGVIATALRETFEEMGIPGTAVDTVGVLPALTTITNFRVTPVVGLLRETIEECPLQLNPREIAQALWVDLETLRKPDVYRTEYVRVGTADYPIHVYQVDEHRIWGVTGSMIHNLLERLQALG